MERYFLTVEWCRDGHRGIFARRNGRAFAKDNEPHTEDEMSEILGPFAIILNPESHLFSEEEIKRYRHLVPLAEYSYEYGIVLGATPTWEAQDEAVATADRARDEEADR